MIEPGGECQPRRRREADAYTAAYRDEIVRAWQSVDLAALDRAAGMLDRAIRGGRIIYACGNGSAGIAGHLQCDVLKGVQTDTALKPKGRRKAANLHEIAQVLWRELPWSAGSQPPGVLLGGG